MKRSIYFVLIIQLILTACSNDSMNEVSDDSFLAEWDITIPYQDVTQTETYHLLEVLIDSIDKNQARFVLFTVTYLNEYIWNNEEATALFQREDCVSVLISTYLISIQTKKFLIQDDSWWTPMRFRFLEFILMSDRFMDKMNKTEKNQLMVLALEMAKYEECTSTPFSIMISIMRSCNYEHFVNDVIIREASSGVSYWFEMKDGSVWDNVEQTHTLLIKYAKQFINDNK